MHPHAATAVEAAAVATSAVVILAEANSREVTSAISADAEASASMARRTAIMVTGAINGAAYGHRTVGKPGAYTSATTDRCLRVLPEQKFALGTCLGAPDVVWREKTRDLRLSRVLS
jgi:hypothetical protein